MADKSFGVKDINLIGASGTPEIESPNNLNIKAVNVAISTDMSVGGELTVADKIIHTGDTNTAIRFPADDTVTVETAGSERLRITSDGKVGIGTTTEGYVSADDLTVATTGSTGITIRSGTSSLGTIAYSDGTSGDAEYRGYLQYAHDSDALKIGTAGAERLRIDSSGRTLIHTSTSAGYADRWLSIGDVTDASSTFEIRSSPTNGYSNIVFTDATSADSNSYIGAIEYAHQNNTLAFKTNAAERLRITSDGKIAIGGNYGDTSTFGRQVLISGTLGLNNDSGNIGIGFNRGASNTYGYIGTGDWAVNGLSNDDFGISSGSTGDLAFGTGAGTEKLRIQSGGGISFNGDTAAANALDDYEEGTWTPGVVNGTLAASDATYIKIGKLVHVFATVYNFSDRTSSSILQITGLPYTGNQAQAAGSMLGRNLDRTAYTSYINSGSSYLEFYTISSGNYAFLQHQHLNASSAGLYFQATYIIN